MYGKEQKRPCPSFLEKFLCRFLDFSPSSSVRPESFEVRCSLFGYLSLENMERMVLVKKMFELEWMRVKMTEVIGKVCK